MFIPLYVAWLIPKFSTISIYLSSYRKCFYVGDRENRCIRKIGYEEADENINE